MAYDKPNHTQTPNFFFDKHLPEIKSLAEMKVTLIVFRGTLGWHEKEVELTVPALIGATGMSRQSVIDGIQLALQRETVKRRKSGRTFAYEANITTVKKLDSSQTRPVKILDQKVDCSPDPSLDGLKKERNIAIPRAYKDRIVSLTGPLYSILDVKDPALLLDTGIMEMMISRHPSLPFGEYYQKWWRSRKVNGGIGKRPRKAAPLDDYATDIESYFQNCVEMAGANGNGHKKNSDDRPIWMASKK